jgi:dienelactone hydrolase
MEPGAYALVVLAHPSASGRMGPRNRQVARALQDAGMATLLLDLLTDGEEGLDLDQRAAAVDVVGFQRRLEAVVDRLSEDARVRDLPLGLFAPGVAAPAALLVSLRRPAVRAVACRAGRLDRAGSALGLVEAPVLLIVGSDDDELLPINWAARRELACPVEMTVVQGASRVFDEPGALEAVGAAAAAFFARQLGRREPLPAVG